MLLVPNIYQKSFKSSLYNDVIMPFMWAYWFVFSFHWFILNYSPRIEKLNQTTFIFEVPTISYTNLWFVADEFCIYFLRFFFNLKGQFTEKEGQKSPHLLVYFWNDCMAEVGWVQMQGVRSFFQVCHRLSSIAFLSTWAGSWFGRGAVVTWNGAQMGCQHHRRCPLYC